MAAILSNAVPIVVLVVVLALDAWVYTDARERMRRGSPVSVSIGSLRIETPQAWFLGCLVLWVVFFPLYLAASGWNPFARGRGQE
ncbi:hypothetical protein AB0C02_01555 [Micromonospora sp. NPDC048999]|uniref:hypothetical protein n=1 Tax=Micromonospora sp. NPDC048999 TaxID=3155391 RepID=UPI0033FF8147